MSARVALAHRVLATLAPPAVGKSAVGVAIPRFGLATRQIARPPLEGAHQPC